MRDFLWYHGFRLFCEVLHPRTRPLELARRVWRPLLKDRPLPVANLSETPLPRIIWIFWAQGWDTAPALVQACRDSWITRNPGWEVRLLTQDDVPIYTNFPYSLEGKRLTPTNYSNLLRLSLLEREGGVWVDATTVCTKPLDTWLPALVPSGLFLYLKPKTTVADWFFAATPNHPLVARWEEYEYRYWRFATSEWRYFWPHYLFEYLLFLSGRMRTLWRQVPRVSSAPSYRAQHAFKERGDVREFLSLLSGSVAPVHKLDWRMELPEEALRALRSVSEEDAGSDVGVELRNQDA